MYGSEQLVRQRHSQGVHFVFCDGAVQMISYQIDFATYQSLGVRNNGTASETW